MSHAKTIRSFYAAWVADDLPAVLALCTDDIVAGIMPGRDLVGIEAVRQFLEKFAPGLANKHYEFSAIIVDGDVGMLEGVESYVKEGKNISLPFMTVFRFRDGKICAWKDYFDMATLTKQLQS
jgi:limonene-1,2-epoxide hydrolase